MKDGIMGVLMNTLFEGWSSVIGWVVDLRLLNGGRGKKSVQDLKHSDLSPREVVVFQDPPRNGKIK